MSAESAQFVKAADTLAIAQDVDVLLINAPILRPLDIKVLESCQIRRKRKNLILILVTEGGDADPAYRIARCLQSRYEKITIFVTGYCKSAGTLLALGANELVIADAGELGPLDVQMSKPDELFERQSGLTATSALVTLHDQAFQAFEHFFLQTVSRSGNAISTKTATSIATQLTCGLFAEIYGHVDPMHVGEAGRALRIAEKYGEMLQEKSGNFSAETLVRLTNDYPSHGFVIDRAEASNLFEHVRVPNSNEQALADSLGSVAVTPLSHDRQLMLFLSTELPVPEQRLPGLEGEPHETIPPSEQGSSDAQPERDAAAQHEETGSTRLAEIREIARGSTSRIDRKA